MCAKVLDPLRSAEARGKVGGLSYNTWRGISTVKTCGSPANQQTAARIEARRKLIYYSQRWQTITQAQRNAWIAYADAHLVLDWTGNPVRLTGHQMYVGLSVNAERAGATPSDDPPAIVGPLPLPSFTATYDVGTGDVIFASDYDGYTTDHFVDIWVSGPHTAGRNPSIKESKVLLIDTAPVAVPLESTLATWASVDNAGGPAWANPSNARLLDENVAEVSIDPALQSDFLQGTALDTPLPAGYTPVGLRSVTNADATIELMTLPQPQVYNPTEAAWRSLSGDEQAIVSGAIAPYYHGSATALPAGVWTRADFNDATFKARLITANNSEGTEQAFIDQLALTIYATPPPLQHTAPAAGWYTYHARIIDSRTGLTSAWLQAREEVP